MKIYLVITPFFPTTQEPRCSYIYDQVKALINTEKYSVVVLKPSGSHKKDYNFEGINVFYFKSYSLPSAILPGLFDRISVTCLIKKLQNLQIDITDIAVVHSHTIGLGCYANALKKINPQIKTILQHHGFDMLSLDIGRFSHFQWHKNYVCKHGIHICNQIDMHVGVSAKTLKLLIAYPGIKIKDGYVLYNGVDTTKFYPIANLKDHLVFKIGCVANFWELKDQITLIKAVELLINEGHSDIRVEFIGSGVAYPKCFSYVNDHFLQPYFVFKTEMFHQELNKFYNSLDLFVLPSYYEAFGCVYTEAYACGVPFIAVKNQGISELIEENEKGKWLIDKQDYKTLATLILDYKQYRYNQNLLIDVEINKLVSKYLSYCQNMIHKK
jgi:glycosyltransferase involved in cell wall biosynthesis